MLAVAFLTSGGGGKAWPTPPDFLIARYRPGVFRPRLWGPISFPAPPCQLRRIPHAVWS